MKNVIEKNKPSFPFGPGTPLGPGNPGDPTRPCAPSTPFSPKNCKQNKTFVILLINLF